MEHRIFGRTGHSSSVLVYGAAGLGNVDQQTADASLAQAWAAGINHYDTAASYGDAEVRMGRFVREHRHEIFLATKTTDRTADGAWADLQRSLDRLQTDHVDLWQIHACYSMAELDKATGPGGALEAFIRAREEGLVNWLGITGHTEQAPVVHAEALRRFDFDSVLTPVNYHLYTADPQFADDFDTLYATYESRNTGLRTIKATARKPWDGDRTLATWYEPFTDPQDIRAAVSWVLGTFEHVTGLPTAGETTLVGAAVAAAENPMSVDEAAAHLARVEDYASPF